ncbi:hypothetical protein ACJMK2_009958 [Sinanodonta woodiana]|uniref:Nuclear GTPase SLIP-GC n=1 Tax=Sinanodonta woodiana TaxID=1069815 RepID=A0ABD3VGV5_SINWO
MEYTPEQMRFSLSSGIKRKLVSEQGIPPVLEVSPLKRRRGVNVSSRQRAASTVTKPTCKDTNKLWSSKNAHFEKIVLRCKEVIGNLLLELKRTDVPESDVLKDLIGDLEKVSPKTELPRTIIALMGGTGTGKSTLVNSLLDSNSILPTSDDRACTSVVVEVVQNKEKNKFEADIEFLQKNDWFGELRVLLEDLTSEDGSLRMKPAESGSDMYVSYCKVKAVYGKIETFDHLSNIESVNQWLGKSHHLTCSASEIEKFRDEIEKFIITKEHGTNTQSLWPIIKHVRIKLPNSDVCSSGASLVDLPGIRDSNPARNKIAKEFLKECHSVWVVNAMPRAIDDVTSRDLLDQGLRRQFLMDGKMESLAFICTMSDRFSEQNTIRTHQLDSMCRDLKVQKYSMEMDKRNLEQQIKAFQDTSDVSKEKARIWELHEHIMKMNYMISKICAKSRNEVCVRHIKRLFRNIKRQSDLIRDRLDGGESEAESEIEREDMEENGPGEHEGDTNIRVFCCSSTEYQKIMGFNPTDGPPMVFQDAEDTQIPALKDYVHELTYARRQKGLEELVRSLGRCVFNFLSYIRNGGRLSTAASAGIETTIDDELSHFKEQMQPAIQTLRTSIDDLFRGQIGRQVLQGAQNAKRDAVVICNRWAAPGKKAPTRGTPVGLHWRSYRATVQRKGVFTLPASNTDINFNQDLADPIYKEVENEWNRVFNLQLPQFLEKTLNRIENETKLFIEHLCEQVRRFHISEVRVKDTKKQLELNVKGKISELLSQMNLEVMRKQREINRILTPFIQLKLDDVYTTAGNQTGKGSTESTKKCMNEGIDNLRHTMFDEAIGKLLGELDTLQGEILKVMHAQCCDLEEDMRTAFEPLWKSLTPSVTALYEVLSTACEEVRQIYVDANLENTEEATPTVEIRPQMGHIPGAPEQRFSNTISKFFKHIPEDQITVKRGLQNDAKSKSKSSRSHRSPDQETMSRWECSVQYTLRNGTSEEIMKVLETCPNDETSEVLLPFVNEPPIQRKILMIITELLQNKLLTQGFEVSIWPGYVHYKSENVLVCMYKKQKPQIGRYFNMEIVYVDIDFFGEMNVPNVP